MTKPKPKPKPKPQGRGSKTAMDRKARIVAAGILKGKTNEAIAKEAGCSIRHVKRLHALESTRLLITDLMAPHRAQLARSIAPAIAAIDRALRANKKERKHDHYVQLGGVDRLKLFLEMAQGKAPVEAVTERPMWTWQEFLVLYASRKANAPTDQTDSQAAR